MEGASAEGHAALAALGAYERACRAANPPVRAQVLAFTPGQLAELFPGALGPALLEPLAWPDPCVGAEAVAWPAGAGAGAGAHPPQAFRAGPRGPGRGGPRPPSGGTWGRSR